MFSFTYWNFKKIIKYFLNISNYISYLIIDLTCVNVWIDDKQLSDKVEYWNWIKNGQIVSAFSQRLAVFAVAWPYLALALPKLCASQTRCDCADKLLWLLPLPGVASNMQHTTSGSRRQAAASDMPASPRGSVAHKFGSTPHGGTQ